MKRQVLFWMSIMPCLLLSGCEPGIVRISEYQKSIKPYIAYWTKEGMTEEERLKDWMECGGMANGSYSSDAPPGATTEIILKAAAIKRETIGECMKAKGYRYVK
ncbi:protein of unknown function [Sterolibacterium denitrificans]|uniref:Lipoprotein n=1 Tax=Sterolibacterium denitrificans TaxID=157592 RepID=A0A7Z7HPC7_9PROT|nr:hypothetical protein [Sterolibacterium denitrificans]SMB21523.1 protein of unknown function [Sterolibacterium denitrificans]